MNRLEKLERFKDIESLILENFLCDQKEFSLSELESAIHSIYLLYILIKEMEADQKIGL